MKKKTLTEYLEKLQETPLNEFAGTGSPAGAAMDQRPDMSGFRGKGAKFNFDPRNDAGSEWPYEDDGYIQYGKSMGNRGRDRGSRPGEDVSGGPPTPKFQNTWEGGPDEVDESPDFDELERHGEPRNVWKDTPDGKEWTELNNEGMGSPGRVGPFAPMDGPQNSSARDAGPVEDENGDAITPQYLPTPYKDMSGPGNMWGGPGTIPGTTGGWANAPYKPEDENDPEKNPMKLREFFNPEPVPVDEVENEDPFHMEDQSDDEIDGPDVELGAEVEPPEEGPESDGDDFGGPSMMGPPPSPPPPEIGHGGPGIGGTPGVRLGGHSLNILPKSPPMGLGMGGGSEDIVQKRSAWDVLQKVVDALGEDEGGAF